MLLRFKQFLRQLGLFSLLGCQMGCFVISSEQKIVGTYALKANSTEITLDVLPNHTFVETVKEHGSEVKRMSGHWKWTDALNIDSLYIPISIVPHELIEHETYSESDHWILGPEWHFGSTILPLFPDQNTNFKMTRSH